MHKIGNEYDLIDYIYKNKNEYFNFDFEFIATEVAFKNSLKAVDMVCRDRLYYYVIEFKRESISFEDFYNIKYIIKNNSYDKPIRGLLVGTKVNDKLLGLIESSDYIDYLIPNNIEYDKNIKHSNKKKYNLEVDVRDNILIKFFENSCGGSIESITRENEKMLIKYYWKSSIEAYLDCSDKACKLSAFKEHNISRKQYLIEEYTMSYFAIDDNTFYIENKYYIDIIKNNNTVLQKNIRWHGVLKLLIKYCSIELLVDKMKNNKLIVDDTTGIELILVKRNNYCIVPITYTDMIQDKIRDINIYPTIEYNLITIIESTRLIINNKVYKPLIKVGYDKDFISIEMSMRLGKKKIHRIYKKNRLPQILNYEFYLIGNIDIILDFEKHAKDSLNKNKYINEKYHDMHSQFLYDKLKRNMSNKTIRDIINDYNHKEK